MPELIEALRAVGTQPAKYRQAFNYGTPAGSANLIASIRRAVTELRAGQLDEATLARKRLAIGACGATSILKALSEMLPQGIVVAADPMYYIYRDVLERKGFEILAVPEDDQGIELAALDRKLQALGAEAERSRSSTWLR